MKTIVILFFFAFAISSCASKKASCEAYGSNQIKSSHSENMTK